MAVAEKFRQEYAEKRQSIQVKDLKDRIPMKALFDPDFLLFSLTRADRTFEYRQKKQDPIILIKDLVLKGTEDVTEGDTLRIHQIEENIKTYGLVKNLERFGVETILFKENNGFTEISYAGMGDGFKALIGLLWHLSSKDIKNKIILIEEPENHMHPGYIEQLVKIIVKFSEELDIQFFITTHNIDFIEYFFNENLPAKEKRYLNTELQVIKMEKTKNVNTLITTYNYSQAKNTLKEVLMDLRGT
jgi:AAA15 family ATPase/GTPase